MSSSLFAQVKNKTTFCLLVITLFTTFFFARSVTVRERWIVPTFTKAFYGSFTAAWHSRGTSHALITVNNWLKENPVNLGFGRYYYPPSVEIPTLDGRYFYGSYPPGSTIQLYILFKLLDFTGFIPDFYEKRGVQLLLVILYKYILHFLTAMLLCIMVFFVCRKLDFDYLNSTLVATIPAIVQFHNAGTLYWNHFLYNEFVVVLLPFVLYIFLEVLRVVCISPKGPAFVRILQPLVMFWGMFTDWLFVFVILTVYIMRIIKKEIDLPVSLRQCIHWAKQSSLFFLPSLLAVALWLCQIAYYSQYIAPQYSLLDIPVSSFRFTFLRNLLFKMGALAFDGEVTSIWQYLSYYKLSLFMLIRHDYAISGLLMIYSVFYMAIRCCKLINNHLNIAVSTYLMLFIPCLVNHLFFARAFSDHSFSPLVFSPSLSISFAFAPIFVLQIMKKSHLIPAIRFLNKKSITIVALAGFTSSILYGYAQVYNKLPVTKMFTPPDLMAKAVGDFVRINTGYSDVVFSKDYYFFDRDGNTFYTVYFSDKVINNFSNLDHVYHKTKSIEQDFTVRILYYEWRRGEMEQLTTFLHAHNIPVNDLQEERIGGLLAFDGRKFLTWYRQVHECDIHPQRCEEKVSEAKI